MKKLLVLFLCLALLTVSVGCAAKNDPETLALSFVENYYGGNYDEMVKTIYPALVDGDFEELFTEIMESMKDADYTVTNCKVTDKELRSDEARADYEQDLNEEYGLSVAMDELYYVTVTYDFDGTVDGKSYETEASTIVAVAKIDGKWYVVNGDESKHYGYATPDEAALTFYEAYYSLRDYDQMATALYPELDTEEVRTGFDEVMAMMAEDDFTCSNYTVSDKELRSAEDCAEWEKKLVDEYGFTVTISELYYVEVTYDFVGTISGEPIDETYSDRLPVAQIDGLWYIIDGVVE